MTQRRSKPLLGFAATILVFAIAAPALAQNLGLNYERLSSMEEPLATDLGGWTVSLTGLVDTPLTVDVDGDEDTELGVIANAAVGVARQLKNRWRVSAHYFVQIESAMRSFIDNRFQDSDTRFTDNVAVSVRNFWGALVAGNVSGLAREDTRRDRGAGNAALQFDDTLAELEEWGAGYHGRFGPVHVTSVIDQDGGFDLGAVYQRPIGDSDYRFSGRFTQGTYLSADSAALFDAHGVGLVAEWTHGSMVLDLALGHDWLRSGALDAERWWSSAGAHYKWGAVTVSLEGHYGQIAGQDETSLAAGVAYDVARGWSANLGVNHVDSQVVKNGVRITDDESTTVTSSVRYSF